MTTYTGLQRIDLLLDHAEETVNDRGNRVRHVLIHAERYLFDFHCDLNLWAQFDTENDASYFGVWCNKSELRIMSFVEGDLYLTECADADSYDAEISQLCSSMRPAPAFIALSEDGRTDFYQDRREFFIDPARALDVAGPEDM